MIERIAVTKKLLRISGNKPKNFSGTLRLPSSKSYFHRALFIASLVEGYSEVRNCDESLSDDVSATITFLEAMGVRIIHGRGRSIQGSTLKVISKGEYVTPERTLFLGGSGTTARFAIAFAALAKDGRITKLTGNRSLVKRPMQPLLDALGQLGVECKSVNHDGRLPVLVRGGGIKGGTCEIDGSISSQFISSLIIACVRAQADTNIVILDSSKLVSEPYIQATLKVLSKFGYVITVRSQRRNTIRFFIKAGQIGKSRITFPLPGDMSSASSLVGSTLTTGGSIKLLGIDYDLPQPDAKILEIAKRFGAQVIERKNRGIVEIKSNITLTSEGLSLDLGDSPDLVPAVFGAAAGLGVHLKVVNIGQLRFKESDRIGTLAHQFRKLGLVTRETEDSISILGLNRDNRVQKHIFLDPKSDHRMLMAFTIAGLSGRLGEFYIDDPDCVKKSYPNFISELQKMMGEKRTIRIINKDQLKVKN